MTDKRSWLLSADSKVKFLKPLELKKFMLFAKDRSCILGRYIFSIYNHLQILKI